VAPGSGAIDVRIASGNDDAEESLVTRSVNVSSTDLELVNDKGVDQIIALRFNNLPVERRSAITSAHVQFKVDETGSVATNLSIRGQAGDNAAPLAKLAGNLSSRPVTLAGIAWAPPAWAIPGESGSLQRTPDLSSIIQEIVDRDGWIPGNSIVLIISGTGKRTARSFNGEAGGAAQLHVEWGAVR
jgi:hypothetical protein